MNARAAREGVADRHNVQRLPQRQAAGGSDGRNCLLLLLEFDARGQPRGHKSCTAPHQMLCVLLT